MQPINLYSDTQTHRDLRVADATALVEGLADRVELQAIDARHVRAVTHLDVSRADVDAALSIFADALR